MTTLNLTNLLAGQVNGYGVYDDNFNIDNLKKINFITAANGLFRVEKTPTALFKTKVQEYKKLIPGLNVMIEGPELLVPKIPFRLLQMALSFYQDVYDKDKTEASLLFFWNKDNVRLPEKYSDGAPVKGMLVEGQLVVYVPRQKNSSGLSEFHMDPVVDWLRNNLALFAETHSHHTMSAFFSGTDNANENSTQFYGVWGKIKDDKPMFAFRYCSGEIKQEICPSALFDWPKVVTNKTFEVTSDVEGFVTQVYYEQEEDIYHGPFPKLDYPADWMEQHTKSVFLKSTYASKHTPSSYFSKRDGTIERMDQLEFDEGIWADLDPYQDNPIPFDSLDKEQLVGGIQNAEIIQYMDLAEEENHLDIQDSLLDIAEEYVALGYDNVIEAAIDSVKRARIGN